MTAEAPETAEAAAADDEAPVKPTLEELAQRVIALGDEIRAHLLERRT